MSGRWVERAVVTVSALALAVVLISLLSGYFTSHDQGAIAGGAEVGLRYADQGDTLLAPGSPRPHYDSDPPTSGPHVPVAVRHDARPLSDDQLLQALSLGNVVIAYPGARPPTALRELARTVAGPFTPALAAAGQAVLLDQRPGIRGLIALAWTRMLRVSGPRDPLLRQFVETYLGARHSAAGGGA